MKHRVLGIMSGTSVDGVDYAVCEISHQKIKLLELQSVSFGKPLQTLILKAAANKLNTYETSELSHELGRFYAKHAPKSKVDYVGLHGQTVYHNPPKATAQIGEPSYLASRLGVPVIHQFRVMDLALGGQGAPLATLFHVKAFGNPKFPVAVNNLGGISNVTFIPAGSNGRGVMAFDTGPANILIDGAVRRLTKNKKHSDQNGRWAAQGLPHEDLILKWLKHPYFKLQPPKSTGRELFNEEFLISCLKQLALKKARPADILSTFTQFTAETIADSYRRFLPTYPQQVILCGGGAYNRTLQKEITRELREIQWVRHLQKFGPRSSKKLVPLEVVTSQDVGWPPESIEAAAFAQLAYQTMNGLEGNIPQATGAKRAAVLGQLTFPG
ncbi:MAG: anhydro-N-acetylmuramic acid kinase [Oligoflexia bacterium]|nr:anhydro-N-acetylmuramic acid kinase [Oligoflexia bacterium]